jgi:hypothetical protein
MSILTTREILEKNIKEKLNNSIALEYMIRLIDPVLAEWNGKQVNKRIVSHVINGIGNDFHVYLTKSYSGAYTLNVDKKSRRLSLPVTYDKNNKKFDIEWFRNNNRWVYEMNDKIKKCQDALNDVDTFANEFERIKEDVRNLKSKLEEKGMAYFVDWKNLIW